MLNKNLGAFLFIKKVFVPFFSQNFFQLPFSVFGDHKITSGLKKLAKTLFFLSPT
jgi:hypothetical protein